MRAAFPTWEEPEMEKLLRRHCPKLVLDPNELADPENDLDGDSELLKKPYLNEILNRLAGEDDAQEFEDLKDKSDHQLRKAFIVERMGWSRSRAAFFTPKCLKELRPEGSVLCWQSSASCFQGYYPLPQQEIDKAHAENSGKKRKRAVKTHWTQSRSYLQKRTKLAALQQVVKWLWSMHKKVGGESCQFLPVTFFLIRFRLLLILDFSFVE